MGRKREHDAATGQALLETAEALIAEGGLSAVSVRALAEGVGTSTRAVYSVFGSKHGLEQALIGRTFRLLGAEVERRPASDDPCADVIAAVTQSFRGFVRDHPDLFRLVFTPAPGQVFDEDACSESLRAWETLLRRIRRAQAAGLLRPGDPMPMAIGLSSLGTGLAVTELAGLLPPDQAQDLWEASVGTFVAGLAC
ncbi:MAG TPA: TetR/AcrR family transcriptional regulator [Actinomycetota bacterium]|nr:TetR/AcrR family transcriptional regulator [Actinomycetota bacterium]